jgi:hypothetical protein
VLIAKTSHNSTNFSKVTSNYPDRKGEPNSLKNPLYEIEYFFGKKKSALWQEVVGLPAG